MSAEKRLAEIEARVEAATAGPWDIPSGSGLVLTNVGEAYGAGPARTGRRADAEFIVHARSDIPWLLEENKRLREALESMLDCVRESLADSGEASGEAAESAP